MLERLNSVPRPSRRLRSALGAALLACGLLAGCGFTDATERVYTPANGANSNTADADVAVLGAVIVSTEGGSGSFVATISNKSLASDVTLTALAGAGEDATVTAGQFVPPRVARGGYVNLADIGGIPVTGQFAAGDFVRVSLTFDNDDRLTLNVPVVANAGDFAGLDGPAPPVESHESEEHG
jgi:hypothetical protein